MLLHDGLVLLAIYVGTIAVGALIDFALFELKLTRKRRMNRKGN